MWCVSRYVPRYLPYCKRGRFVRGRLGGKKKGGGTGARASDLQMDLQTGIQTSDLQGLSNSSALKVLVRLTAVLSFLLSLVSDPASLPALCPVAQCLRPEKKNLCQSLTHPSHVTSYFRRFWIFPRFSSLLCYAASAPRPARPACFPPVQTKQSRLAGKEATVPLPPPPPPKRKRESKGSGLSTRGSHTDGHALLAGTAI